MKPFFLSVLIIAANTVSFAYADPVCDDSFRTLTKEELALLIAPLKQKEVVRSTYTQKRVMRLLKKPLLAEGRMIYAPEQGLYWQVDKPFSYQLIMNATQFVQINGSETQIINASDQPGIFAISTVFADLFSGNLRAAENYFSLAGKTMPGSRWSLCLIPDQEPFSRLMAYIRIDGFESVQSVHMHDKSDDYTDIHFTPDAPNGLPLTDAEKAYFTHP